MKKIPAPIGETFGHWLIVGDARESHARVHWRCRCECGKEMDRDAQSIRSGQSKSCCGIDSIGNYQHGLTRTVIGNTWKKITERCYSRNCKNFHRYGGRGVVMCEFLRASPANLLAMVGERPSPKHSVDRVDNARGYSCGQCAECYQNGWVHNLKWSTSKEQNRNRRDNRLLTFGQETKTMAEWAERAGINYHSFQYRVNKGLDPFAVVKKP